MSTLRDHLSAAHGDAWREQRHEDEIAILRALAKLDGTPLRRPRRDRRTDDEKDDDENGIYF